MINCGIDWAEAHHDVALVDDAGKTLTKVRVSADAAGFSRLLEVIVEQGGSPEVTPVAIETDKNLSVVALAAAGFRVYPINPRAVARYRERHVQSGGKSDPGDAIVLANILRTDRHCIGGCRRSASTPWRSRRWPVNTRRPSGPGTRR